MRTAVKLATLAVVGTMTMGCSSRALYVGGPLPGGVPVYRIEPGVGIDVAIGQDVGYFITANVGGSYRIVWTGDYANTAQWRHFTGSAWTAGSFLSTQPGCAGGICSLESDDYVSSPRSTPGGERIDWDTFAADGLDGVDFVVDTEPVYIAAFLDGNPYPDLISFHATDNGGAVSPSGAIPFGLMTQ